MIHKTPHGLTQTGEASASPGRREDISTDVITIADVGEYIADVLSELRSMADQSGQRSLSVLLELAQREARQSQPPAPPRRSLRE